MADFMHIFGGYVQNWTVVHVRIVMLSSEKIIFVLRIAILKLTFALLYSAHTRYTDTCARGHAFYGGPRVSGP